MPKIWCWHPGQNAPNDPVNEENYRCCCGCCTATCGFKAFVGFILASASIGWIGFILGLLTGPSNSVGQIISLLLLCVYGYFGYCAIKTKRPYFIQVFLIILAVHCGFGLFSSACFFIYILSALAGDSYEARQNIAQYFKHRSASESDFLLGLLVVLMIISVINIWQICLVKSYYNYLRDLQLEIEEHEGPQSKRDLEKNENYLINPPPY
ncbi:unnamed protein product, partial [Mesorhabditis belari]|uniref:Uncharacterized protein n=1 Tax=Mesorhabditis belari TaxID=2138241 RepID=A0AAF3FIZ3_9BILA